MIGIDTNLLVRIYAGDDPAQKAAAIRLIETLPEGECAVVNAVVVVELLWTLDRVYKFDPEDLQTVARNLTEHRKLVLPEKDLLREAAYRAREETGDIPDHLIALINRRHGAATTYTFDKSAGRATDFTLLSV